MGTNNSSSCCKICMIISVLALVVASAAYFCPKKSNCMSSTFDEKIRNIMLETVRQNPQILMDAMGEGLAKKREAAVQQLSNDISQQRAEISKQSLKFGNLESKNTIICFFDPLCKYCIDFQKTMLKLIKQKKDVRFELVPISVIGDDSTRLAQTYISVYSKGVEKTLKFIETLLTKNSDMDASSTKMALSSAGINVEEIEGMKPASDQKLLANGALAEKLQIPVVPALFIEKNGAAPTMIQASNEDQILDILDGKDTTPAAEGN